jgi:hypothetical protein
MATRSGDPRFIPKQISPRASNRNLQLGQCCYEDVNIACLDLLNCPNVEIGPFGQNLLAEFGLHPLAPDIAAQFPQLSFLCWCS